MHIHMTIKQQPTLRRVRTLLLSTLLIACGGPSKKVENNETQVAEVTDTPTVKEEKKIILFYGNSITAGYQLDMDQAFPALIQRTLDSLGYHYTAINAGLSGETSAGGKSRIDWVLKTVPSIFFLELGANDGLRGLPLEETKKNLQDIIDRVKKVNPNVKIIIAGMMVPPNLGDDYANKFQQVFPTLASANKATYIPFLLEGVAGEPELNLPDGIHPTAEGHQMVFATVWKYLEPLLEKESDS